MSRLPVRKAFGRRSCHWAWALLAAASCTQRPADDHDSRVERRAVRPVAIATFSIIAVDPESGVCGAAVASKYPAVGRVVPYVQAGVGAFCAQHWHEPSFGPRALELLADHSPQQVLGELLAGDPRAGQRQLAAIDRHGNVAQHNPVDADAASRYWGAQSGRYFACQGNTLAGRDVVTAMAKAYEETAGSLADRLMAALVAADRAGGDDRGRLAAGIRVAKAGHDGDWLALYVDHSSDAVEELLRAYLADDHPARGDWTGEAHGGGDSAPRE